LINLNTCSDKPKIVLKDNTQLFDSLNTYKAKLVDLKALNDSLVKDYNNNKIIKDSIVYHVQTKYLPVFDTITNDTIECLPKQQVDTIINTYENLLSNCDTVIAVKDSVINNLEVQNSIKDTVIFNYQSNEKVLKKEVKRQKRKKWLFGGVGVAVGYFLGKIF